MKYTGNMSFEDIEKAIPVLAKRGTSFRQDIQCLLVSVARQWHKSGNVAHAAKLLSRIVNEIEGYYGQALADYAQGMFGMTWDQKAKALIYSNTTITDDTLKAVIKEPFWQFSPPKSVKANDFLSLLDALLDKNAKASSPEAIAKRQDKGIEDKLIPLDKVRAIKELLAQG